MAGRTPLREIEGGLKSCEGKLAHLGIQVPARSSLSYANGHRPWQLFEKVFYGLFDIVAAKAVGKKKFRLKNKLVSLDSTVIDLCLSLYDWAKFRRTKGAVKLHLVLDHDGYLPCFGTITEGKVDDVKAAHQMHFTSGTIVVDDRGYNDYRLFAQWTDAGVYFVTRMKDNALFEVVEEREPPHNRGILKDQIMESKLRVCDVMQGATRIGLSHGDAAENPSAGAVRDHGSNQRRSR